MFKNLGAQLYTIVLPVHHITFRTIAIFDSCFESSIFLGGGGVCRGAKYPPPSLPPFLVAHTALLNSVIIRVSQPNQPPSFLTTGYINVCACIYQPQAPSPPTSYFPYYRHRFLSCAEGTGEGGENPPVVD